MSSSRSPPPLLLPANGQPTQSSGSSLLDDEPPASNQQLECPTSAIGSGMGAPVPCAALPSANALDPVYGKLSLDSKCRSETGSSDGTKVDGSVYPLPMPANHRRPRTPNLQIDQGKAADPLICRADSRPTSILGLPVTASPVDLRGGNAEDRHSIVGEESGFVGLDPEADRLLQAVPQLYPEQPTGMQYRLYNKPAGIPWSVQGEDDGPRDDEQTAHARPAPHRAMSGPYRGEDDIDRDLGCLEPAKLSGMDWTEKETPDGYPYFRHKYLPIVTDDYLRTNNGTLERVDNWAKTIHDIIWTQMRSPNSDYRWPEDWELYLRVETYTQQDNPEDAPKEEEICYYYLVNMDKREVFWLHSFPNFSAVISEIQPHASSKLIRLHLQRQFWAHVEIFSEEKAIPGAEKELRDMLLWAAFDRITSPTGSTSPFEKGQAEELLGILDQFKGTHEDSKVKNVAIARLMGTCYCSRIFNRFGEHGARIDRNQRQMKDEKEGLSPAKFALYMWLHILVFGGDRWYYDKIKNLTVDDYVPPQGWKDLVKMLVETNNESTLIVAALLFTGNIGFLGINTAVSGDQVIISIVATLLSLGSLFVGLQQVLHHYDLKETTATAGGQYCYAASQSWLGYHTLAIYYALPNALLVWSAIATVVALLAWCFQTIELDWGSRSATIVILAGLAGVGLAVLRFSHRLFGFARPSSGRDCWAKVVVEKVMGFPYWLAGRLGAVCKIDKPGAGSESGAQVDNKQTTAAGTAGTGVRGTGTIGTGTAARKRCPAMRALERLFEKGKRTTPSPWSPPPGSEEKVMSEKQLLRFSAMNLRNANANVAGVTENDHRPGDGSAMVTFGPSSASSQGARHSGAQSLEMSEKRSGEIIDPPPPAVLRCPLFGSSKEAGKKTRPRRDKHRHRRSNSSEKALIERGARAGTASPELSEHLREMEEGTAGARPGGGSLMSSSASSGECIDVRTLDDSGRS